MGGPSEDQRQDTDPRWAGRPFLAGLVRFAVLLVPTASGIAAGVALARSIPRPNGLAVIVWLLAVLGASTLTVTVVERAARRLLPLATLLNLSLAFPDHVPSRFKLARQAGNVRVLQQRVQEAREHGLDPDPARAAETILSLVAALSAHDRKTRGHSERVRAFTDMLAEEFDLSPADRDRLRWAALLHDVGKLEVPSATLNKAGKPDEAEWEALKRHPFEGERIAAPLIPWLGEWAAAIGMHHERWDGGGYPRGLSGEQIGLAARLVSVADSFEVMTAARSYKRPMTPSAARRELQRCAGKQFDPQVVRAFFGISVRRLWWTVGPTSWVAQIPFMLGIGRTGGQAVTLARAASAVAINGLVGLVTLGVAIALPATGAPSSPRVVASAEGASLQTPGPDGSGSGEDDAVDGDDDGDGIEDGGSTVDDPSGEDDGGLVAPPGEVPADEVAPGDDPATDPAEDPVGEDPESDDIVDVVDETVDDVDETVDDTVEVVDEVVDDTVETVEDVVDDTVETVEDVVDDVVDDVTDTVDDVTDTVDDVVDDVLGGLG
jgi:HD-GYP domain-containing protein (c-di-GMP phosphodiesterase class II)